MTLGEVAGRAGVLARVRIHVTGVSKPVTAN